MDLYASDKWYAFWFAANHNNIVVAVLLKVFRCMWENPEDIFVDDLSCWGLFNGHPSTTFFYLKPILFCFIKSSQPHSAASSTPSIKTVLKGAEFEIYVSHGMSQTNEHEYFLVRRSIESRGLNTKN